MPEPLPAWLDAIDRSASLDALTGALSRRQSVLARGVRGSASNLVAGLTARALRRTVLLVVAHLDEADDALDDLEALPGVTAERFGAMEALAGDGGANLDLVAERLDVVKRLAEGAFNDRAAVLVAPIQALMQAVPEPDTLGELALTLRAGEALPPGRLFDWLDRAGYSRQDAIDQPGDFAARGGIIDLYPLAGRTSLADGRGGVTPGPISPIRLDYFGDDIESIHRVDPDTLGSGEPLLSVGLVGANNQTTDSRTTSLLSLLPPDAIPMLHETLELSEQARGYYERLTNTAGILPPGEVLRDLTARPHVELNGYSDTTNPDAVTVDLPVAPLPTFDRDAKSAIRELGELADDDTQRVTVLCAKPAERERLVELLIDELPERYKRVEVVLGMLHRGFVWEAERHEGTEAQRHEGRDSDRSLLRASVPPCLRAFHLIPHHELFHRYETRRRVRQVLSSGAGSGTAAGGDAFLDLSVGDYVVHVDHGIAKFIGLKTIRPRKQDSGEKAGEYLTLQFADQALLHVPAAQIDLIQKYIGGFEGRPPLSTLGGKRWQRQKDQVADAVKDMAAELLRVQAARQTQPGIRYPADSTWQREFEAEFPYDETEDQLAAVAAIKNDMSDQTPMDRLICGDVGFGKTEVAIRAAFKAVEFGKQVAVLVPTTVLAEQHERTFTPASGRLPVHGRIALAVQDREGAAQDARPREGGAGRRAHRHAPHLQQGCEVRGPRAGDHRRGAAVRGRAQEQAAGVSPDGRRVDAQRDADPADAAHVDGGAAGHLIADDAAGGPPGDRDGGGALRRGADPAGAGPRAQPRRAGVLRPQPRSQHP